MANLVPGLFQGKWEGKILETRLSPDNLCPGSQFHIWATGGKYCGRIEEAGKFRSWCRNFVFAKKNSDDNVETEVFLNPCFGLLVSEYPQNRELIEKGGGGRGVNERTVDLRFIS